VAFVVDDVTALVVEELVVDEVVEELVVDEVVDEVLAFVVDEALVAGTSAPAPA